MTRSSLTFVGNAFRSAEHITFAHGPVQNRIRPILHQKCNLQNYASRSSQKHIFAKLLQTKIKTYNCKRKSKFLLHFWAPSEFWFSPMTCAILASWTPSGKVKLCVTLQIFCVVMPCTLFLKFCMAPQVPLYKCLLNFLNFASCSSGKHNSESRSYAKAQKLAPFGTRN